MNKITVKSQVAYIVMSEYCQQIQFIFENPKTYLEVIPL
jgi:hypothetical protein